MNQKNTENLPDIRANTDGQLVGKSLAEQMRIAKYYVASGLLPKGLNTPEKAMIGLQYCHALGLKPATALRQVCVVNGKPTIYGDLPLAIVRQSGKLKSITERIIDKEGKEISPINNNLAELVFAGICQVVRADTGEKIERFFTIEDAKRAGLLTSDCWRKYPKDMLKYRARGQALKDGFSDVLSGAAIAEYDYGIMPEVEPTKTITANPKENKEATEKFLDITVDENIPENEVHFVDKTGNTTGKIVNIDTPENDENFDTCMVPEFENTQKKEEEPEIDIIPPGKRCVKIDQECTGCGECEEKNPDSWEWFPRLIISG